MTLDEIKTTAWQLSSSEFGAIMTEIDDISQGIMLIMATQKGSDPLNPLFGVDLMKWIDKPTSVMIPNLINEITRQVSIWEPRAIVGKVTYQQDEGHVTFDLQWTSIGGMSGNTQYTYNL